MMKEEAITQQYISDARNHTRRVEKLRSMHQHDMKEEREKFQKEKNNMVKEHKLGLAKLKSLFLDEHKTLTRSHAQEIQDLTQLLGRLLEWRRADGTTVPIFIRNEGCKTDGRGDPAP